MRIAYTFALIATAAHAVASVASAADKNAAPSPGAMFRVSAELPKYVTCDIEFRPAGAADKPDAKWPNFFYGKPAGDGSYTYDPSAPKAEITVVCEKMVQRGGEQDRRILGELCTAEKQPKVTFTLKGAGTPKTETVEVEGKGGKKMTKTVELVVFDAVLDVDGKKISVKANTTVRFENAKENKDAHAAYLDSRFTVKASDLGLKAPGTEGDIAVRVGIMTYSDLDGFKGKKKK
jgi:hypothetical protein